MNPHTWNETARGVAEFVRQFHLERGALSVQLPAEHPSTGAHDSSLIAGAFGNDYALGELAQYEVELIRTELRKAALEELGFGVSADGSSWAMLIAERADDLRTAAGKAFRQEMLAMLLGEVVWGAWKKVIRQRSMEIAAGIWS